MSLLGSLLVANRGEIAVRVLRAARAAGVRAIAVYSDADREALHVREADEAHRIGPAPAAESYLSITALIEAARRSGADAVHPGYGFLSENADFARACEAAGLVWVGPPAGVIERMGRKDEARRLALAAGVPVLPALEDSGDEDLRRRVEAEVGFPAMVKAVAGGGGRGMRVVRGAGDLDAALAAARREARSAFGDERLLVERYVERPRHVEVQVLADAHGHVLHLHERDCSVQRRHQKVVEEAPAPTISDGQRVELAAAAVSLAREVGYVGAGTVEFMVAGDEVLFLEMNARLQVEHPVTEALTGHDLVALQLLVAGGEELPFGQDDVAAGGHAIEARVYAEDPASGFLPQAGRASTVRFSARARVDRALDSGQAVGTDYDPMLAKLTVHAATREGARRALVAALDDSAVFGVKTNMGFLRRLVDSPEFAAAQIDTDRLDREPGAFARDCSELSLVAAAWACTEPGSDPHDPFAAGDGWRLGGPPAPIALELSEGGERRRVTVERAAGTVALDGRSFAVRAAAAARGALGLEIDGVLRRFFVELEGGEVLVAFEGETTVYSRPESFAAAAASEGATDGSVSAPMPGTVLSVVVEHGAAVEAGEAVVVLEAMKMELALAAPRAGTVEELRVAAGDRVALGELLFSVASEDDGE